MFNLDNVTSENDNKTWPYRFLGHQDVEKQTN